MTRLDDSQLFSAVDKPDLLHIDALLFLQALLYLKNLRKFYIVAPITTIS